MTKKEHDEKVLSKNKMNLTSFDLSFDFVTLQAAYLTIVIADLALIAVVSVFGLPGNVLNAAVFYRQGLGERINLCLFALAVVNLIVLISLLMSTAEELCSQTFGFVWVMSPFAYCE